MDALLAAESSLEHQLALFMEEYPLMALRPSPEGDLKLTGSFAFAAEHPSAGRIDDAFNLTIVVSRGFPENVPEVFEIGGRIPKVADYHVNGTNHSLCLGSPLRLRIKLSKNPTLVCFASECLIPFLYAMSHSLASGSPLPFGELAHGTAGVLEDYREMLGLKSTRRVPDAIKLLGMKKRLANKLPCPCECGQRVGICRFNSVLHHYRLMASRPWYREESNTLPKPGVR